MTNLDILIKQLLSIDLDIEWSWLGEPFSAGKTIYTLNRDGNDLILTVANGSNASFMINRNNLSAHFGILREESEAIECHTDQHLIVPAGQSSDLIIHPDIDLEDGDLFFIRSGALEIFFEL